MNDGREEHFADRRQFRRQADPGRQPLSFLRNQCGLAVRPRPGARHAARHSGRNRRAVRARSDPRGTLVPLGGSREIYGFQQKVMGSAVDHGTFMSAPDIRTVDWSFFLMPAAKGLAMADHADARCLCRHVRADGRRPRPARRHVAHRRNRERPHDLWRRSEIRRRQGHPRRHGPVADRAARKARSIPSSPMP